MVQLEAKLCSGTYCKDQALVDGREFLTQHTLELLQTRILHTYLNIQQQKLEVSRLAGEFSNASPEVYIVNLLLKIL